MEDREKEHFDNDTITKSLQHIDHFDNLLKCPICYEYFDTCMITQCSHNFCSPCIQQHLVSSNNCPMCFSSLRDSPVRPNRAVDHLKETFFNLKKGFYDILQIIKPSDESKGQFDKLLDVLKLEPPKRIPHKKIPEKTEKSVNKLSRRAQENVAIVNLASVISDLESSVILTEISAPPRRRPYFPGSISTESTTTENTSFGTPLRNLLAQSESTESAHSEDESSESTFTESSTSATSTSSESSSAGPSPFIKTLHYIHEATESAHNNTSPKSTYPNRWPMLLRAERRILDPFHPPEVRNFNMSYLRMKHMRSRDFAKRQYLRKHKGSYDSLIKQIRERENRTENHANSSTNHEVATRTSEDHHDYSSVSGSSGFTTSTLSVLAPTSVPHLSSTFSVPASSGISATSAPVVLTPTSVPHLSSTFPVSTSSNFSASALGVSSALVPHLSSTPPVSASSDFSVSALGVSPTSKSHLSSGLHALYAEYLSRLNNDFLKINNPNRKKYGKEYQQSITEYFSSPETTLSQLPQSADESSPGEKKRKLITDDESTSGVSTWSSWLENGTAVSQTDQPNSAQVGNNSSSEEKTAPTTSANTDEDSLFLNS